MAMPALDAEDAAFEAIWTACGPSPSDSWARGLAMFRAIRYLGQNFIAGDIVQCGVGRGDGAIIAMLTLRHFGIDNRRVWLFDRFADEDACGGTVSEETKAAVQHNLSCSGYPTHLVQLVSGDIAESLRTALIGPVALLRLGVDSHADMSAGLDVGYPQLVDGGVLVLDDFGAGRGGRHAADAFFDAKVRSGQMRPMLQLVDETARIAIRPTERSAPFVAERYDYHPPGLIRPELLARFPEVVERDPSGIDWPFLRRQIPHVWRSDARAEALPDTGLLSVEEAILLYNNALCFSGGNGLEIGCHFGWSSAHLHAAGLHLDIVDPALANDIQNAAVRESLDRADGSGRYDLWAGFSPHILSALRARHEDDYDFVFIDGCHDGVAPLRDAEAVMEIVRPTSCVMLHDLISPFVAAGLAAFAEAGWNTGIYNTMQIMGVAWRGAFTPVRHVADPAISTQMPAFLNRFKMLSAAP